MKRAANTLAVLALMLGAVGCANKNQSANEVVVFAAASLTDAFTDIAREFEKENPGVRVKLNFAGSQSLRTQIENGAQPHVFASANEKHMEVLSKKDLINGPIEFVQNELVVAVPSTNPAGIQSFADLPKAKRIVLADRNVPAGAYAETVLDNACASHGTDFAKRVKKRVVSREMHVRQTLQKVVLGEADAAIVYATDAAAASSKIKSISIPAEHNVQAAYPIASVPSAPHSELGDRFIQFVFSKTGAERLSAHGFRPTPRTTASLQRSSAYAHR